MQTTLTIAVAPAHPSRMVGRRPGVLALVLCAGMAAFGPASGFCHGQSQDGRALERDLRVGGGGGFGQRKSMRDEVMLRNALITGNVGGLRAFRGNVGYTAPDDFRGSLGSDSLFRFNRDSSSTMSLRGVDSLRYQFGRSAGPGLNASGGMISRLGATGLAAATATPGTAGMLSTDPLRAAPRADRMQPNLNTQGLGTLRSTAAFTASQSLLPTPVGSARTPDGSTAPVTASGLLGVRRPWEQPSPLRPQRGGSASDSRQRPGNASGEMSSQSLNQTLSNQPLQALNTAQPQESLQGNMVRTVYDELRERMEKQAQAQRDAQDRINEERRDDRLAGASSVAPEAPTQTPGVSALEARLQEMRARLGNIDARTRDEQGRVIIRTPSNRAQADAQDQGTDAQGAGTGQAREGQSTQAQEPRSRLSDEDIDLIRRSARTADRFIDPTTGQTDFFLENMTIGQEMLGAGRFFDAEERFANALNLKPGDVAAQAARVHAQLGAGMYLSAASNLRKLFAQHPEVVGMRYTDKTIPSPQRLRSLAAELRSNIQRARDRRSDPLASEGFLLAYIGFQTGDRSVVEEGIAVARSGTRSASERRDTTIDNDVLVDMIQRVWMAPPDQPVPAPNPAP